MMRLPIMIFARTMLCVTVLCLTAFPALAGGAVYVDDDASPGGDGASWATAFTFLQDAITVAEAGGVSEIRLAQGTYRPDRSAAIPAGTADPLATFALASGVTMRGGYAGVGAKNPDLHDSAKFATILTGESFIHHVLSATTVDPSAAVADCIITSGNANGANFLDRSGGGLLAQTGTTTLTNCTFELHNAMTSGAAIMVRDNAAVIVNDGMFISNSAPRGGAIDVNAGTFTMTGGSFTSNASSGLGGAVYSMAGTTTVITGVTFAQNASQTGGGAWRIASSATTTATSCVFTLNTSATAGGAVEVASSNAQFSHCRFIDNTAVGDGGAVAALFFSAPTLMRCVLRGNEAQDGGALLCNGLADAVVTSCIFENNAATGNGGAVFLTELSEPVFANGVFIDNTAGGDGGAMHGDFQALATLINCTIARNVAGGSTGGVRCFNTSDATLINTILWENTDAVATGEAAQITTDGAVLSFTSCCVEGWTGGFGGSGNTGVDPVFKVFPRLSPCSPVIDAGTNAIVSEVGGDDVIGGPRFVDMPAVPDTGVGSAPLVDLGAYETQSSACPADVAPFQFATESYGNGAVNIDDLVAVINAFGATGDQREDIAPTCGNGVVNIDDLIAVLNAFGACL